MQPAINKLWGINKCLAVCCNWEVLSSYQTDLKKILYSYNRFPGTEQYFDLLSKPIKTHYSSDFKDQIVTIHCDPLLINYLFYNSEQIIKKDNKNKYLTIFDLNLIKFSG